MKITDAQRAKLGMTATERPWTGRPNIRLRGASRQLSARNLLYELVDLHWVEQSRKCGLPVDSESIPDALVVDIRQEIRYQLSSGGCSLLSASRIYHYRSDRCLCAAEHFRMNGWSSDGLDLNCLVTDTISSLQANWEDAPKSKRKRGKQPEASVAAIDVAGNAVSLPDFSLFGLCGLFGLNHSGLWLHDDLTLSDFKSPVEPSSRHVIEFHPGMSQRDIRRVFGDVPSAPEGPSLD